MKRIEAHFTRTDEVTMWQEIAAETGKSLWREVGEDVVKKGAAAVVVEATKAIVDVMKRRRIRRDEWEFKQWKDEQSGEESESDADESESSETHGKPDDDLDSSDETGAPVDGAEEE